MLNYAWTRRAEEIKVLRVQVEELLMHIDCLKLVQICSCLEMTREIHGDELNFTSEVLSLKDSESHSSYVELDHAFTSVTEYMGGLTCI